MAAASLSTSGHDRPPDALPDVASLVADLWRPAFPTGDLVGAAADLFPTENVARRDSPALVEAPQWEILVAPGLVQVRTRTYARLERRAERAREQRRKSVDVRSRWTADPDTARAARPLAELSQCGCTPAEIRARVPCAAEEDADAVEVPDELHRFPDPFGRKIDQWSRKSRRELAAKLARLDLSPLVVDDAGARRAEVPGVLTLTYPGRWLEACPDDRTAKRHLDRFRKRYVREWLSEDMPGLRGRTRRVQTAPMLAVWKMEFQDRGAPHFHVLTVIPTRRARDGRTFRQWLSDAWAEAVDAPDPDERARHRRAGTRVDVAAGLKMTDPKRVAEYFLKHGTGAAKEYQHRVPAEWLEADGGTGRFWGVWGLEEITATRPVTPAAGIAAGRVLRRWYRAQMRAAVARPGEAGQRARRYRTRLFGQNRGRVLVNDGAVFASQLARAVALAVDDPPRRC